MNNKKKLYTAYVSRFCLLLVVKIISFYKLFISPHLLFSCRYLPTCSTYCLQAYQQWGLVKGTFLSLKRILSCHPFAKQKVAEVPLRNKKQRKKEVK